MARPKLAPLPGQLASTPPSGRDERLAKSPLPNITSSPKGGAHSAAWQSLHGHDSLSEHPIEPDDLMPTEDSERSTETPPENVAHISTPLKLSGATSAARAMSATELRAVHSQLPVSPRAASPAPKETYYIPAFTWAAVLMSYVQTLIAIAALPAIAHGTFLDVASTLGVLNLWIRPVFYDAGYASPYVAWTGSNFGIGAFAHRLHLLPRYFLAATCIVAALLLAAGLLSLAVGSLLVHRLSSRSTVAARLITLWSWGLFALFQLCQLGVGIASLHHAVTEPASGWTVLVIAGLTFAFILPLSTYLCIGALVRQFTNRELATLPSWQSLHPVVCEYGIDELWAVGAAQLRRAALMLCVGLPQRGTSLAPFIVLIAVEAATVLVLVLRQPYRNAARARVEVVVSAVLLVQLCLLAVFVPEATLRGSAPSRALALSFVSANFLIWTVLALAAFTVCMLFGLTVVTALAQLLLTPASLANEPPVFMAAIRGKNRRLEASRRSARTQHRHLQGMVTASVGTSLALDGLRTADPDDVPATMEAVGKLLAACKELDKAAAVAQRDIKVPSLAAAFAEHRRRLKAAAKELSLAAAAYRANPESHAARTRLAEAREAVAAAREALVAASSQAAFAGAVPTMVPVEYLDAHRACDVATAAFSDAARAGQWTTAIAEAKALVAATPALLAALEAAAKTQKEPANAAGLTLAHAAVESAAADTNSAIVALEAATAGAAAGGAAPVAAQQRLVTAVEALTAARVGALSSLIAAADGSAQSPSRPGEVAAAAAAAAAGVLHELCVRLLALSSGDEDSPLLQLLTRAILGAAMDVVTAMRALRDAACNPLSGIAAGEASAHLAVQSTELDALWHRADCGLTLADSFPALTSRVRAIDASGLHAGGLASVIRVDEAGRVLVAADAALDTTLLRLCRRDGLERRDAISATEDASALLPLLQSFDAGVAESLRVFSAATLALMAVPPEAALQALDSARRSLLNELMWASESLPALRALGASMAVEEAADADLARTGSMMQRTASGNGLQRRPTFSERAAAAVEQGASVADAEAAFEVETAAAAAALAAAATTATESLGDSGEAPLGALGDRKLVYARRASLAGRKLSAPYPGADQFRPLLASLRSHAHAMMAAQSQANTIVDAIEPLPRARLAEANGKLAAAAAALRDNAPAPNADILALGTAAVAAAAAMDQTVRRLLAAEPDAAGIAAEAERRRHDLAVAVRALELHVLAAVRRHADLGRRVPLANAAETLDDARGSLLAATEALEATALASAASRDCTALGEALAAVSSELEAECHSPAAVLLLHTSARRGGCLLASAPRLRAGASPADATMLDALMDQLTDAVHAIQEATLLIRAQPGNSNAMERLRRALDAASAVRGDIAEWIARSVSAHAKALALQAAAAAVDGPSSLDSSRSNLSAQTRSVASARDLVARALAAEQEMLALEAITEESFARTHLVATRRELGSARDNCELSLAAHERADLASQARTLVAVRTSEAILTDVFAVAAMARTRANTVLELRRAQDLVAAAAQAAEAGAPRKYFTSLGAVGAAALEVYKATLSAPLQFRTAVKGSTQAVARLRGCARAIANVGPATETVGVKDQVHSARLLGERMRALTSASKPIVAAQGEPARGKAALEAEARLSSAAIAVAESLCEETQGGDGAPAIDGHTAMAEFAVELAQALLQLLEALALVEKAVPTHVADAVAAQQHVLTGTRRLLAVSEAVQKAHCRLGLRAAHEQRRSALAQAFERYRVGFDAFVAEPRSTIVAGELLVGIPVLRDAVLDVANLMAATAPCIDLVALCARCDVTRYQDGISQSQTSLLEALRDGGTALLDLTVLACKRHSPIETFKAVAAGCSTATLRVELSAKEVVRTTPADADAEGSAKATRAVVDAMRGVQGAVKDLRPAAAALPYVEANTTEAATEVGRRVAVLVGFTDRVIARERQRANELMHSPLRDRNRVRGAAAGVAGGFNALSGPADGAAAEAIIDASEILYDRLCAHDDALREQVLRMTDFDTRLTLDAAVSAGVAECRALGALLHHISLFPFDQSVLAEVGDARGDLLTAASLLETEAAEMAQAAGTGDGLVHRVQRAAVDVGDSRERVVDVAGRPAIVVDLHNAGEAVTRAASAARLRGPKDRAVLVAVAEVVLSQAQLLQGLDTTAARLAARAAQLKANSVELANALHVAVADVLVNGPADTHFLDEAVAAVQSASAELGDAVEIAYADATSARAAKHVLTAGCSCTAAARRLAQLALDHIPIEAYDGSDLASGGYRSLGHALRELHTKLADAAERLVSPRTAGGAGGVGAGAGAGLKTAIYDASDVLRSVGEVFSLLDARCQDTLTVKRVRAAAATARGAGEQCKTSLAAVQRQPAAPKTQRQLELASEACADVLRDVFPVGLRAAAVIELEMAIARADEVAENCATLPMRRLFGALVRTGRLTASTVSATQLSKAQTVQEAERVSKSAAKLRVAGTVAACDRVEAQNAERLDRGVARAVKDAGDVTAVAMRAAAEPERLDLGTELNDAVAAFTAAMQGLVDFFLRCEELGSSRTIQGLPQLPLNAAGALALEGPDGGASPGVDPDDEAALADHEDLRHWPPALRERLVALLGAVERGSYSTLEALDTGDGRGFGPQQAALVGVAQELVELMVELEKLSPDMLGDRLFLARKRFADAFAREQLAIRVFERNPDGGTRKRARDSVRALIKARRLVLEAAMRKVRFENGTAGVPPQRRSRVRARGGSNRLNHSGTGSGRGGGEAGHASSGSLSSDDENDENARAAAVARAAYSRRAGKGKSGTLLLDLDEIPATFDHNARPPPHVHVHRFGGDEGTITEITTELLMGGAGCAANKRLLLDHGVTAVLNVAGAVVPNHFPKTFKYKRISLANTPSEDLYSLMYDVVEFVEAAIEDGGRVYIHCMQGTERSAAMVVGYLMFRDHLSFDQAFRYVKYLRSVCATTPIFRSQLEDWARNQRSPPTATRLFSVVQHNPNDPGVVVAKPVRHEIMRSSMGPKSVFLIIAPSHEVVYIWKGLRAAPSHLAKARLVTNQLQFYESAPKRVLLVVQGDEPADFWECLRLSQEAYEEAQWGQLEMLSIEAHNVSALAPLPASPRSPVRSVPKRAGPAASGPAVSSPSRVRRIRGGPAGASAASLQ